MNSKYMKFALLMVVLLLFCQSLTLGNSGKEDKRGDILVHLRLYEGSRGNELPTSSVVSAYYLKPLFVSKMVTELSIREEKNELKRIFNLSDIKLMTQTQLGWKYRMREKLFHMMVLNGHEFQVMLTMKGRKNGFRVEVWDKSNKEKESLLDTEVLLPEKKSTVFGFEDSLRKPFFICLQREENQSFIYREPVQLSLDKPILLKRVNPVYPKNAIDKKIQGEVILDATIDTRGNVKWVTPVDGAKELMDAARKAVLQWKYKPYYVNGKARMMRFTVVVHFNLPGETAPLLKKEKERSYIGTGDPIDISFKDADIKDVLRVFSQMVKINIVVDPGVDGSVSCRLKKVPWEHALSLVLQVNGLDMIRKGNVIRIVKASPESVKLKKNLEGKTYNGHPINLNFKDAELKQILRIIATIADAAFKMEPGVDGRVSINVNQVPWDQSLDLITQLNGLGWKLENKILKIFKVKKPVKVKKNVHPKHIPHILPTKGYLVEVFGPRKNPDTGKMSLHAGVDIEAKEGSEVIAPADGVVTTARIDKGYGNLLIVDHGKGYTTRYGHLAAFNVIKGQKIKAGQLIAFVGKTGKSGGKPHLHYEVRLKDKPINPMPLLRK
jgi:TonB family protein